MSRIVDRITLFDDVYSARSPGWLWRQLDRVAPTRRSKVALLSTVMSAVIVLLVAVRLVAWLNYAKTDRLGVWTSIDKPAFRMSLVGMTKAEVLARFGSPNGSTESESWTYRTGRREGSPFAYMHDESVVFDFSSGVVGAVTTDIPSWGCMRPGALW